MTQRQIGKKSGRCFYKPYGRHRRRWVRPQIKAHSQTSETFRMKPSTGNTSIVQPKCCCHGSTHFIFNYTVIMQALSSIILGNIWNRHGKWSVITLGFGFQLNWLGLFCRRQKTTTVSAFCVWTGVADMSLCSWVCSLVNCHRYGADGDTLFCQVVNVLKALGGLVIPKSCG